MGTKVRKGVDGEGARGGFRGLGMVHVSTRLGVT